jgi:hypothetical protein
MVVTDSLIIYPESLTNANQTILLTCPGMSLRPIQSLADSLTMYLESPTSAD